jgi:SAM-dependent methyltransferase
MTRIVSRNVAVVALTMTCILLAQGFAAETEQKPAAVREPDVVFVPTPNDVVDKMLELADVKKADVLYDLGCGDGRIVIAAAKKVGCQAIGYDIDPKRGNRSPPGEQ